VIVLVKYTLFLIVHPAIGVGLSQSFRLLNTLLVWMVLMPLVIGGEIHTLPTMFPLVEVVLLKVPLAALGRGLRIIAITPGKGVALMIVIGALVTHQLATLLEWGRGVVI